MSSEIKLQRISICFHDNSVKLNKLNFVSRVVYWDIGITRRGSAQGWDPEQLPCLPRRKWFIIKYLDSHNNANIHGYYIGQVPMVIVR